MRKESDLIVRGTAFGKKSAPVPPPVSHEESQISLVSSDNPQGTSDYLNCKTLFRELELQTHLENSLKSNNLRDLEYHQADLQMREALLAHRNPPKSVGNVITAKFKNDYKYMQPIHKETVIPDSAKGLIPGISIREQLEILRAQEKYLLLERWKEHWEAVRPPRSKWWQDKSPAFSIENRKCREMLQPENQREQYQVRADLFELYRQLQFEKN